MASEGRGSEDDNEGLAEESPVFEKDKWKNIKTAERRARAVGEAENGNFDRIFAYFDEGKKAFEKGVLDFLKHKESPSSYTNSLTRRSLEDAKTTIENSLEGVFACYDSMRIPEHLGVPEDDDYVKPKEMVQILEDASHELLQNIQGSKDASTKSTADKMEKDTKQIELAAAVAAKYVKVERGALNLERAMQDLDMLLGLLRAQTDYAAFVERWSGEFNVYEERSECSARPRQQQHLFINSPRGQGNRQEPTRTTHGFLHGSKACDSPPPTTNPDAVTSSESPGSSDQEKDAAESLEDTPKVDNASSGNHKSIPEQEHLSINSPTPTATKGDALPLVEKKRFFLHNLQQVLAAKSPEEVERLREALRDWLKTTKHQPIDGAKSQQSASGGAVRSQQQAALTTEEDEVARLREEKAVLKHKCGDLVLILSRAQRLCKNRQVKPEDLFDHIIAASPDNVVVLDESNEDASSSSGGTTTTGNNDVVAKIGTATVSQKSFALLEPRKWFNDEIINFYLILLLRQYENCTFFKSFFFAKILRLGDTIPSRSGQYDFTRVRDWSEISKRNIFRLLKLLLVVHREGNHWGLVVCFMVEKRIQYYDSLGRAGGLYLSTAFQFLKDEHLYRHATPLPDAGEWRLVDNAADTPTQENTDDSGVFMCHFAELILKDIDVRDRMLDANKYRYHMRSILDQASQKE